MEKKQLILFNFVIKIMGIKSTVDDIYKKSVERSLQRDNQKLEKQFDELFKNLFDDNSKLNKIILPTRIPYIRKEIEEILYYNGLDLLLIDDEKGTILQSFAFLSLGLFKEYCTLYENYYKKIGIDISDKENLFFNFFNNNISSLFKWFIKETPFSQIQNFSEIDLYENGIDNKPIYDWKKGNHIMTVETIIKIRNHLENIAFQEKIINIQDYIDFFIFQLYIESCKLRLKKEFINITNIDEELLIKFKDFFKDLNLNRDKIENLGLNRNINIFEIFNFNKYKDIFNSEKNTKDYYKYLPYNAQRHPQYRINENSFQEDSIIYNKMLIENPNEFINDFKNITIANNIDIIKISINALNIFLPLFNKHFFPNEKIEIPSFLDKK